MSEVSGLVRLQINEHAAMTWENDLFGLKSFADRLTILIHNTHDPYVMGLTSPWGSGKTFFLQAWRKQLLADQKPCIYFNAWEQDASGDPLVNLMAAIHHQVQQTSWPQILHSMRDGVMKLAGLGAQVMKGAAFGLGITGNPAAAAANAGAEGLKNLTERISGYYSTVAQFNEELTKLAAATACMAAGFPLFIMVDELDRCRPSYAIDLLERIKHLFNVPQVVFLLAVDSSQLLQQVEHTFGLKRTTDGICVCDCRMDYLGKFFDIFFRLPKIDKRLFVNALLDKIPMLSSLTERFKKEGYIVASLAGILSAAPQLFEDKSLRTLAQRSEFFSVFVRTYAGSSLEEIFLAYIAIFSSTDGILNAAKSDVQSYISKINAFINEEYRKLGGIFPYTYNNNEYTDLFIDFCYFILVMNLINEERHRILITAEKNMYEKIIFSYASQRNPTRERKYLQLHHFTEELENVCDKLNFLSEFSTLPPTSL